MTGWAITSTLERIMVPPGHMRRWGNLAILAARNSILAAPLPAILPTLQVAEGGARY